MSDCSQLSALPAEAKETTEVERTSPSGVQASNLLTWMARAISWILEKARKQQVRKVLRVSESVSLGEKRFVAVVQVAHERFLIGGASGSVSMLARLESGGFADVLQSTREAAQL